MQTVDTPPITTHPRAFKYRTTTEWLGRRNCRLAVPGKESIVISSPPEFRGEGEFLNPEEIFVAAVETCLMLTFASMAESHHLPVEAYYSEATGDMEFANGGFRFTKITVRPTIIITDAEASAKTLQVLQKAERECLISNSIHAEMRVLPEVVLSASE